MTTNSVYIAGEGNDYSLFGSDPATEGTITLQFTAYLADYITQSTKTATFDYAVTNTCANVVITAGIVYEDGVQTDGVVIY